LTHWSLLARLEARTGPCSFTGSFANPHGSCGITRIATGYSTRCAREATPYRAALSETQVWVVKNETQWDHPFHLHGFFFMLLDGNDRPLRPLAWKDTVNVPMKAAAKLLVTFDERPGTWMFHCHILDHADGGLMGTVHVGSDGPVVHRHHSAP
jgi:FtsP/CotA-like multicopper oxidase with cupredoxin domain